MKTNENFRKCLKTGAFRNEVCDQGGRRRETKSPAQWTGCQQADSASRQMEVDLPTAQELRREELMWTGSLRPFGA